MSYKVWAGFFVAVLIGLSAAKPKKEFEGIITYSTVAESKTEDFTSEKLQSMYGDVMTIYYKNGNYKMVFTGQDIKEIYYLKAKNAQYAIRNGIDTMFVSDCSNEIRPLVSSTFTANAEKVLKRNCNLIVNDLGDAKNWYWFDPDLYVNPDNFKAHVFGFVSVYYEKAQAIWIKYKYEGVFFNLTHTAKKIKRTKVPDSVFELPKLPEKQFY